MSSPNTSLMSNYSTSPTSPSANTLSAVSRDGRKRNGPIAPVYSPNETLNQMTQEAEAKQLEKSNVQRELRGIRAQEMEKQRKEDEEREKNEQRFNRAASTTSLPNGNPTTMLAKPPRPTPVITTTSSRSSESTLNDEDNPKELKKKLAEMEEKYKKHAIYQTQFENDNQKLLYEVDLLKDLLEEHEELIIELRRQFKEKSRELDYQKRTFKDLQTDFHRLKEILKQRDTLIEDSGLVLYTDNETKKKIANANKLSQESSTNNTNANSNNNTSNNTSNNNNDSTNNEIKSVLPAALVAPETAKLLDLLGEGTIDDKLRRLLSEKQELKEHNNKLLIEIDEERARSSNLEKKLVANASKLQSNQEASQDLHEIQRQYTKEINELKMKLQKIEHENIIIKQDKQRLDTQLKYLQTNFDELEQTERRLIKEKREQQRELNESKNLINDLQCKLEVLQKTLEKKRQPSKFIDTTNTNSSTSLSSSFNPSPSALTPATQTNLNTPTTTLLNSSSTNSITSNNNDSSSISETNSNNLTRKKSITSIDSTKENLLSTESNNTTQSTAILNVPSESSLSPTTLSSSNSTSNSSSSSTSPSSSSKQNDDQDTLTTSDLNNMITPIKVHKGSTSSENEFLNGRESLAN